MKPPPFEYHRAETIPQALEALAQAGEDGKVLAGGQSLIPVLNFRLTAPSALVDLNPVTELDGIEIRHDGRLRLGAMVRQRTAERASLVRTRAPLLAMALPWVAHAAIRNRGTVGGSLAHADPASELPAVMIALEAQMVVTGPQGDRTVDAEAFFPGFFSADLQEGELLREVLLPPPPPGAGWGFAEVARRHGDFALAGAAAAVVLEPDGRLLDARVGLFGVGTGPMLATPLSQALVGHVPTLDRMSAAAAAAAAELSPPRDLHASASFRRHLARVLMVRTLEQAIQDARARRP